MLPDKVPAALIPCDRLVGIQHPPPRWGGYATVKLVVLGDRSEKRVSQPSGLLPGGP